MGFLNVLGDIAKVALPIAGTVIGGPFGAAVGAGLSKVIGGIQQKSEANSIKNPRPVDTPESQYLQNEAEANANAHTGLPEQQYVNQENAINRNQNFGLRAATNRGGGLASVAGLVQASNDANANLNAEDANAVMQNQKVAYGIRGQLARRRQQAFDWNDKQKFLENSAAIRALKGASNQNIFGGLTTIAGAGVTQNGTTGTTLPPSFSTGLSKIFSGSGTTTGGYADSTPETNPAESTIS